MIAKIKKILKSQFEIELFESALRNLEDEENKLRYNNFAYSIRELSRHFLHSLSPENSVKSCSWYKTITDDDKPTRAQRIKYAIQGGLSDELLTKNGFDIEELREVIKSTKNIIGSLSKYTHINEDIFDIPKSDVDLQSKEVLEIFAEFVETIDHYRQDLKSSLDGELDDHILNEIIWTSFNEVDILAPHHQIEYSELEDYEIEEINNEFITVSVNGNLNVTLEYGSKNERRDGDGLDLHESFPFTGIVKYKIGTEFPSKDYEVEDLNVDTGSWYGEEE
jgi:hypothetical protein